MAKWTLLLGLVVLSCCALNYATTQSPSYTLSTQDRVPECRNNNDVIFLLDSSGSVGADYYKKAKFFAYEFARTFQNRQTSRFGFTIFSTSVRRVVPLCTTLSPADLSSAILNADYMAEQTFTNLAINSAIGEFADCSRPFTKNLVIITDGISNDPSATLASINYANQQGIRTFAVGVGADTSYAELIALAGGQSERLATVSSYDGLTTLLNPLRQLVCNQEGQTGGCECCDGVFEEKVEQSLLKLKQLQFTYFSDCEDALTKGFTESGVYRIKPGNSFKPFKVWCDMEFEGGGWIVIQSRFDGSEDFYRTWKDYRNGFGSVDSEHWLGNNFIRLITEKDDYELKIELTGFEQNEFASAKYSHFRIGSEDEKYTLYVSNFTLGEGVMIDALSRHSGYSFTTKDSDNDDTRNHNCAVFAQGAWWFWNCFESNLNGLWMSEKRSKATKGPQTNDNKIGIIWKQTFGVHFYSLKRTEMKLRKRR